MSTLLHCHTQHFRVWGTQGWQLVLPAIQSLPIWEACENYEYDFSILKSNDWPLKTTRLCRTQFGAPSRGIPAGGTPAELLPD